MRAMEADVGAPKNRFFYKLIPPRPTFVQDMTEAERKAMGEHAINWKDLIDKGVAIVWTSSRSKWRMGSCYRRGGR